MDTIVFNAIYRQCVALLMSVPFICSVVIIVMIWRPECISGSYDDGDADPTPETYPDDRVRRRCETSGDRRLCRRVRRRIRSSSV